MIIYNKGIDIVSDSQNLFASDSLICSQRNTAGMRFFARDKYWYRSFYPISGLPLGSPFLTLSQNKPGKSSSFCLYFHHLFMKFSIEWPTSQDHIGLFRDLYSILWIFLRLHLLFSSLWQFFFCISSRQSWLTFGQYIQ